LSCHAEPLEELALDRCVARSSFRRLDFVGYIPAHTEGSTQLAVRITVGLNERLDVSDRLVRKDEPVTKRALVLISSERLQNGLPSDMLIVLVNPLRYVISDL